ncbi:MAG: plasmid pRiA4b ORF-3 family protein [Clostridiales bacterium]|jgi:hypothetical protein|nr:plasmid pRiA4b ORF-3 family protein [Clostridiales bacterium]
MTIYEFKSELNDFEPLVWRRFQVTGDITLSWLAYLVMTLFEMKGSHLFSIELYVDENTVKRYEVNMKNGLDSSMDAAATKLSSVITAPGAQLSVTYDYGGGWVVLLKLENVFEDPGTRSPWAIQVLEGERFGIVEYHAGTEKMERLAEAYKAKKGESYDDLYEMLGKDGSFAQEDRSVKADYGIDYSNADFSPEEVGEVEYGKIEIAQDATGRIDFSDADYADYGNIEIVQDALGKMDFVAQTAPVTQAADYSGAPIAPAQSIDLSVAPTIPVAQSIDLSVAPTIPAAQSLEFSAPPPTSLFGAPITHSASDDTNSYFGEVDLAADTADASGFGAESFDTSRFTKINLTDAYYGRASAPKDGKIGAGNVGTVYLAKDAEPDAARADATRVDTARFEATRLDAANDTRIDMARIDMALEAGFDTTRSPRFDMARDVRFATPGGASVDYGKLGYGSQPYDLEDASEPSDNNPYSFKVPAEEKTYLTKEELAQLYMR